jgi:FRG domain
MSPTLDNLTSAILLDNFSAVCPIMKEISHSFNADTAYWRGHSQADWSLVPKVFRPRSTPDDLYDEHALIGHFRVLAPTRHLGKVPAHKDCMAWLFLAQHHGLPTRLLDWSESLLIASYFAVSEEDRKAHDGCVWAINPGGLNSYFDASPGLVQIRDKNVRKIAKCAFLPGECDKVIIALDGQEIDIRMFTQMVKFTLHSVTTRIEQLPTSEKWLRRYIIPKEAKTTLQHQLAAFGIKQSNLFPDLSHLAADLCRRPFGS